MPARILLVDDDEDLLATVASLLEIEGYAVETAPDGSEALAAALRSAPDLILLDLKMPVMNGWEFAREYRARTTHPAPIVVLSAVDDPARRAEEVGAIDFIPKPFETSELFRVVGSRCGGARG